MRSREINVILIALAIIFFVTLMTILIAQTVLTPGALGFGARLLGTPQAQRQPTPAPLYQPLVDSDVIDFLTLRSAALGLSFNYPAGWRKKETTLSVVVSPSTLGLTPPEWRESALWLGIPAGDAITPSELLNQLVTDFGPVSVRQETLTLGEVPWQAARVTFVASDLGGPAQALVATTAKNEVVYFLVAVAPEGQWPVVEPVFERMLTSFQFTQQAVLRPTDATPPPTPTATPTPVVYVVQSGDTLGGIAVRFGVDMEALANRNGIEDPRRIRTGQQLIIPIRR